MGMNKIEEFLYEAYNIGRYKEVLIMSKNYLKNFRFWKCQICLKNHYIWSNKKLFSIYKKKDNN